MQSLKKDILKGLTAKKKYIPSKYMYDEVGDDLFIQIMHLPEYYVTRSELEIFNNKTGELIDALGIQKTRRFDLIELGAGDGLKTKILIKELMVKGFNFEYIPVDISKNALNKLVKVFEDEFKALTIKPKCGDFIEVLNTFPEHVSQKIVLFLGSTLGNMDDEQANLFMKELSQSLNKNDVLLLGVDLIKDKSIVLPAYNDKEGVTAKFNLNLLRRINEELNANFQLHQFKHHPEYSEKDGKAKSYIVSLKDQRVRIEDLNLTIDFKKNERIFTEISRKYNDVILENILHGTRFSIKSKICDSKNYFADYVLERV